jgi:hypothetical protein
MILRFVFSSKASRPEFSMYFLTDVMSGTKVVNVG